MDVNILANMRHLFFCICLTLILLPDQAQGFMLPTDTKWADGCRYVFLDVGANIGMHERFLFEPEMYPNQGYSSKVFDMVFPLKRMRSDVCVIGVEANRAHDARLNALRRYFESKNLNVYHIHGAASNESAQLTFYHQNDENDSEWGFSTFDRLKDLRDPNKGTHIKPPKHNNIKDTGKVIVDAFSLPDFIMAQIHGRDIPPALYPTDPPPAVVLKMDVEGAEYKIFPALIQSGAWCTINYLTVEFHPLDKFPNNDFSVEERAMISWILATAKMFSDSVCRTTFSMMDDENYHNDTDEGLARLKLFHSHSDHSDHHSENP